MPSPATERMRSVAAEFPAVAPLRPPVRPPRRSAGRTPVSRATVEQLVLRGTALVGLVYLVQTVPLLIDQASLTDPVWTVAAAGCLAAAIATVLAAAFRSSLARPAAAGFAIVFLIAQSTWVFATGGSYAGEMPWVWYFVTVAVATATYAFPVPVAAAFAVLMPVIYVVQRLLPAGGGVELRQALLDGTYTLILGGTALVIITLLRQAAAAVDTVQATALGRYGRAVRQHATELERVHVDAIVHDSVLTTLLTAARAGTPEEQLMAAQMARSAMGHLRDGDAVVPPEAEVSAEELHRRLVAAAEVLQAPFELMPAPMDAERMLPAHVAEALYSAAVQAMVNSAQHAGEEAHRTLQLTAGAFGVAIEVRDDGIGFDPDALPPGRLGVRVSIIDRVASVGGRAELTASAGHGVRVRIVWAEESA